MSNQQEPSWGLSISPEAKDGIFEEMAQLFIDTYEELIAAMEVMKAVGIDPEASNSRLNNLQIRYMGIIEKYQKKIFEEPTLIDPIAVRRERAQRPIPRRKHFPS